jgi:predicted  nucleic acid-binding Zn-ribbon protein
VKDEIEPLEERVERAVERLRELSAERRRLASELRALRERIHAGPEGSNEGLRRWDVQRADVVATLRESIELLRG